MFYLTYVLLTLPVIFKEKLSKPMRFLLAITPLLIIVFFRFGFGADYFSYNHLYNRILVDSMDSLFRYYTDIEIGYKLIMWPFRILNIPFHVYFVVINTIIMGLILKWIEDNSVSFEASVLLFYSMFFFVWVLSAVRQAFVMSFALYYLFNEKKSRSTLFKLLLILILSLIHKSALILFVYILFDKISWTRKKHIVFFALAIGLSFLPLNIFLKPFLNISIVNKISAKYLSANVKLYDFPGLIRFVFYLFVFIFYNLFHKENKKYADRFLYGLSFYYIFKFSEITASRLTIFTFIGIVLLIPIVVKYMGENMNNKYIFTLALLVFSGFYFNKELKAMAYQSAYKQEKPWVKMETIFNPDTSKFYKRESFVLDVEKLAKNELDKFNSKSKENLSYRDDFNYLVVKNGHKDYRIISDDGNFLEDYKYSTEVILKDGILVEQRFYKNHFFSNPVLIDLSGKERSKKEKVKIIDDAIDHDIHFYLKEEKVPVTQEDIPDELIKIYSNVDKIENVWMTKLNDPFEYYVMRVDYIDQKTYIYLDENMNPLINLIFTDVSTFDDTHTARVASYNMEFIINERGEIIWEYTK